MNLRPGNLPRFFVCHSLSAGFFEVFPTIGFCTTASLKWSTTAAMAKTPPSRSYRLFSASGAAWDGSASATVNSVSNAMKNFLIKTPKCGLSAAICEMHFAERCSNLGGDRRVDILVSSQNLRKSVTQYRVLDNERRKSLAAGCALRLDSNLIT